MAGLNLVKEVTTSEVISGRINQSGVGICSCGQPKSSSNGGGDRFRVKRNILRRLASYGCKVIVSYPYFKRRNPGS